MNVSASTSWRSPRPAGTVPAWTALPTPSKPLPRRLGEAFGEYVERYPAHLEPGFARLLAEVKTLLDPEHLMNPGRWNL